MYLCPITSTKLISARAGGHSLWYSPHSKGRMLTLSSAKHFFGVHATRELWVRAGANKNEITWKKCPSCSKKMWFVQEPEWVGQHEIDICKRCHLIWLDEGEHKEVPAANDMLAKHGDSTIVADVAESKVQEIVQKEKMKNEEEALVGGGPAGFIRKVPSFFGLPVEMSDHGKPSFTWVTWLLGVFMFGLYFFYKEHPFLLIQKFGFIPKEAFRMGGATLLTSNFIHAGWFHLLTNLYFFGMVADDLEEYLGKTKFLLLMFTSSLFVSLMAMLAHIGSPVPQVGLSGVVMALMVNYGLIFRKSRIAFLIPYVHTLDLGRGKFGFVRSISWIRLSALWVVVGYIAKDLLYYYVYEKNGFSMVAHSAHLSGALFGLVFWLGIGRPSFYSKDEDVIPSGRQSGQA